MLAGSDLLSALPRRGRGRFVAIVLFALALVGVAVASGRLQLDGSHRPPRAEPAARKQAPPAPQPSDARPRPAPECCESRPIESWLGEIAADAGLGLVIGPGVAGTAVTAVFGDDSDWRLRLRALSRVHGLVFRDEDGLLEVEAATAIERSPLRRRASQSSEPTAHEPSSPGVPSTAAARAGSADAAQNAPAAASAAESMTTAVVRLANARAKDLLAALEKPLAGRGVGAGVDAATNTVVFAGPASAVGEAVRLARALDLPRRRFLLEAHIVELSRSARNEMGIQWTLESNDIGGIVDLPAADAPGEGAGVLVATSGSHSLRARLSALESSGRIRVVSRPRVVVLEGKAASIEAVRILRVRLPDRGAVVSDSDSGVTLDSGRAFEEIPVGVTLSVEPSLQGDGNVVLRIVAKSSTLGPPQPPDDIPEELSRRVEAEVAVADGHTAVLGGLLREGHARSGTGVPVLRSLPLLGALFGKKSRNRDVEELIVLVTPHLVG